MPKLIIIYGSGSKNTEAMAKGIFEGAKSAGVEVSLKNAVEAKKEDFNAEGIVFGGSTYKKTLIATMKRFLEKIEGINLKGKIGAAFGSYGESGEGVSILIDWMQSSGMDMMESGLRIRYKPDKEGIEECKRFGRAIAEKLIAAVHGKI